MSAGVDKGGRQGINPWLIAWIVSIATFMRCSTSASPMRCAISPEGWRLLRSGNLDTDQLSGRKCRDPSGQRLALVGLRPQAILHALRRSLHGEFAAMWIGLESRTP